MTVAFGEYKFNCGITGLRKIKKMSMTLLVLVFYACQQCDEIIEAVKTILLDNHRITIREVADHVGMAFCSCEAIFTDVLGMKRAAAKIVPKIAKF